MALPLLDTLPPLGALRPKRWALWIALLVALPLHGQTPEPAIGALVSIALSDGTRLQGAVIAAEDNHIVVKTAAGLEVKVPRTSIVAMKTDERHTGGAFTRSDPNYSRLMFAPTGRPLQEGTGYFSNYYVFFPGYTRGLTDQIGMTAGLSLFPGVGLDNQILTLAPKITLHQSGDFAFSTGVLYMNFAGEGAGGMAFAVGTKGLPDKSFTLGLGLGYIAEENESINFAEHPVIVFGGNIRLSDNLALVSENWIITGENMSLAEQPFGIACRFFGQNLAVDLGAIIVGEVIAEGFPIPWLSFVYHFGN